jgi:hypothetical protein
MTAPLATSGGKDVSLGVPARRPLLLLPARLETRFSGTELWVRVYPDQVFVDAHEPELTAAEAAAGTAYWDAIWRAGNPPPAIEDAKRPWRTLAATFGPNRAAWIAAVMTPVNVGRQPAAPVPAGQPPPTDPVYPAPVPRASSWEQPPRARALPDRWILALVRGGQVTGRYLSAPVPPELAVGPSPQPGTQAADIPVDEGMRWMVDFAAAQAAGMAWRVPLTADERATGFDRLLVYGVRADPKLTAPDDLAGLLACHHYTDGLSFVPQGSPTNNTPDAASAFSRADPGYEISFAVERGDLLTADPAGDGPQAAAVLGLPAAVFGHVRFADRAEQVGVQAMAAALWPATLGYYLAEMMPGLLTAGQAEQARGYFTEHVRARGPVPALRTGVQPYGILPATSLRLWRLPQESFPVEAALVPVLLRLLPTWLASAQSAPHVGGTGDPDADLAGILGMDASSMTFRGRPVFGPWLAWNLLGWLGASPADATTWWDEHLAPGRALLTRLAWADTEPVIATTSPGPASFPLPYPAVQDGPLSETDPLRADAALPDGTAANYIRWLRDATVGQLQAEEYPGPRPTALLYRLLRQSLLREYHTQAVTAEIDAGTLPAGQAREAELTGIGAAAAGRLTPWQVLARPALPQPSLTWAQYLHSVRDDPRSGTLPALLAALDGLAGLPTAELDRLLSETLDVCSHRLDAWVTSIATSRLRSLRPSGPAAEAVAEAEAGSGAPVALGAFAWAEDVRPTAPQGAPPAADSAGYLLAPSPAQAAAAAVLRNGYLTHQAASDGRLLAIDLSSDRVRNALSLLDGVRAGQPLGALLGYQFELALTGASLQPWIQPFRDAFPLVTGKLTPAAPGESAGASNVVDGVALQAAWQAGTLSAAGPWPPGLPPPGAARQAVIPLLEQLDDMMDSLSDLSVAEGVYQIIRGNPGRAGGILDAVSRGDHPPDPQIVATPRSGYDITHRVLLLLAGAVGPAGGWAAAGPHPRAGAEPRLDRWLGHQLPDPRTVKASVSFTVGGAPQTASVFLADLDIGPLDFLAMAKGEDVPQAGELERRILYHAVQVGAASPVIDYGLTAADAGLVSIPDAVFAAQALADFTGGARPLQPADLIEPARDAAAAGGTVDAAEFSTRAGDARQALHQALAALAGAAGDAATRDALLAASYFGIPAAVPDSPGETGRALADRVTGVLAELTRRDGQAQAITLSATDPGPAAAVVRAVFGPDVAALPQVTPPDLATLRNALAASAELTAADPAAPARWMQQLTHVRTGLSRLDAALTVADLLAGERADLVLGQLPFASGARWLALELADPPPPAGSVSLACVVAGDPAASGSYSGLLIDEWVERIPAAQQPAGLAFHYDEPRARAPQSWLLMVCPDERELWDAELAEAILAETLDLAQVRTVDLASVSDAGQLLPALYLPFNPVQDTIAVNLSAVPLEASGAVDNRLE